MKAPNGLDATEAAGIEAAERVCVGARRPAAIAGLATIRPAVATPRKMELDFNMPIRSDTGLPVSLAW